jgi:hypothetical protein
MKPYKTMALSKVVFSIREGCAGGKLPDSFHLGLRNGFSHAIMGTHNMLEIGFNAGYSALVYLYLNPRSSYTGVDLFLRPYTKVAFQALSNLFPHRANLIKGSSLDVLPRLSVNYHDGYDVIHVDGGHTFECAYGDLCNVANFATRNSLVILDDSPAADVAKALEAVIDERIYTYHPLSKVYKNTAQRYLVLK